MAQAATTIDEQEAQWKARVLEQGHVFQRQEPEPEFDGPDGPPIDWFAVSHDIHNGPRCTKCGWSCCHHCTRAKDIPPCKHQ